MHPAKLPALCLGLALIGGCTGTPPPRPEIPRPKPVEAMQPEPSELCQLRDTFDNLDLGDQLALVSNCHAMDAEHYRRLERKYAELRKWIDGN